MRAGRNPDLAPRAEETDADRAARVRRLAQLVRGGDYDVQAGRLAAALLDWDPRRGAQRGTPAVAERRRTYMREYMRRRRAEQLNEACGLAPAAGPPGSALALSAP